MYVAFFQYLLKHMVSEESDSMGRAYIVFNVAKSHLPKVHLLTSKRKITSRLAPRVYVKTRESWRRWRLGRRIRVGRLQ